MCLMLKLTQERLEINFLRSIAVDANLQSVLAIGILLFIIILFWFFIVIKYKLHPLSKELRLIKEKLLEIKRFIKESEKIHKDSTSKLRSALKNYIIEVKNQRLQSIPIEKLKDLGIKRIPWSNLKEYGIDNLKALRDTKTSELLAIPGVGETTVRKLKTAEEDLVEQVEKEPIPLPSPDLTSSVEMKIAEAALVLLYTKKFHNRIDSNVIPKYELLWDKFKELKSQTTFFNWIKNCKPFANWMEEKLKYETTLKDIESLVSNEILEEKKRLSKLIRKGLPKEAVLKDFQEKYVECISLIEHFLFEVYKRDAQRIRDATTGKLPSDIVEKVKKISLNLRKLKVTLRKYQEFGVKYILSQKRIVLGDEMGLGKTIEALGAVCHISEEAGHPVCTLVVCPASLVYNWAFEVKNKTDLRQFLLYGSVGERREAFEKWRKTGGVAITSYNTLSSFPSLKENDAPFFLIVDEAHFVKNPNAKRSVWVKEIASKSEYVCLLTGTPLENHPREFVNLLKIINPELANRLSLSEVDVVSSNIFKERVASVYIRRNQKDVLMELPTKIESSTWLEMENRDKVEYRKAVLDRNFHRMRLVSIIGADGKSSKIERLKELIDEYRSEGKKVVVFSFYLKVLEVIQNVIDVVGVLKGEVTAARRADIVEKFQKLKGHAVLASQINVGGHGLNLHAASVVVLMEPQLKPTLEDQAVARVYRMGQTDVVTVHKLITRDSVEERIVEILQKKRKLFDEYARDSVIAGVARDRDEGETLVKMVIDAEYRRIVRGEEYNGPQKLDKGIRWMLG